MNPIPHQLHEERSSKNKFQKLSFLSSFEIRKQDYTFAIATVILFAYLSFTSPALLVSILLLGSVSGACYLICASLPIISRLLKYRISIWHVLTLMIAGTLVLNTIEPSHALFLRGLEQAVSNILAETGGAGGGASGITTQQIAVIFTAVRVILIFMIVGGLIMAMQNANQGQSPAPMFSFVGIIFAFIVIADVATFFVVGDGTINAL